MKDIKLVATDLDGTFLKNDRTISERNLEALERLGEKRILRVAATGRNLRKVKEVINGHVPFDYIVFSSGAGVFDWKTKEHLFNQNIGKNSANKLIVHFKKQGLNFHAFFPAPDNHKHWFYRGKEDCEEFERYFNFNNAFAYELKGSSKPESDICQFLIIIPENKERFESLKKDIESICPEVRVIRTSSPITNGYIWIEIFQKTVSKGNGVRFVCDQVGINYEKTVGIGNDYNDFDLLDFTAHSYFTENAPPEIAHMYGNAPSNEDDAFAVVTQSLVI